MSNTNTDALQSKIYLQIKEAVAVSGISRTSIYKALENDELPSRKILGRRLIRKSDLEKFLDGATSSYSESIQGDRRAKVRG